MTTSTIWTTEATTLRCPHCSASPGARCRTSSGRYATGPHAGRLVPSFACPRCGTVTTETTNVASGYCTSCRDWTATHALAAYARNVERATRILAAQDELDLT